MKYALTLALIYLIAGVSLAQEIDIQKRGGGYKYYQEGKPLRSIQLKQTLSSDKEAFAIYKSTQSLRVLSGVLGFAGGFIIGREIGNVINNNQVEVLSMFAGAAVIGLSLVPARSADKKTKIAVDMYNEGLSFMPTKVTKPQFALGISEFGVGIRVDF